MDVLGNLRAEDVRRNRGHDCWHQTDSFGIMQQRLSSAERELESMVEQIALDQAEVVKSSNFGLFDEAGQNLPASASLSQVVISLAPGRRAKASASTELTMWRTILQNRENLLS